MSNSKAIRAIGCITALISLVGCAGKIRYPSYYALNVATPTTRANGTAPILGSVAVRQFEAPGYLRGGPIVYRESPEQLDFYEYHRWAADPRRTVTRAVIREMQSRGIFQAVDLFNGRETPECLLTGAIDHLEEVDEGATVSIEVALSAQLINLKTGELLWQGSLSKESKLDQHSVAGIVAEMSREVGNIVEGLVSSMQEHVRASSASLGHAHTEP